MRIKAYTITLTVCALLAALALPAQAARTVQAEAEVRGLAQQIFQQLKAGDYDSLYDTLPTAQQRRISRERFKRALARSRDAYELDRLEVGTVRTSGDLAVVDTVMYGRVLRPIQSEGKIVAQQYLVREEGRWRVATGDRATVQKFLAANPTFARKFPIRSPRIYVRREGRWVDVSSLSMPRRRT
ncbi:MAG TPA: hypothetical protein VF528_10475 [Pyrinomonadaceae bacterium]|jgi:hypothetical protein